MSFRSRAIRFLKSIDMTDIPAGYLRDLEALDYACAEYRAASLSLPVLLLPPFPHKGNSEPLYAGNLDRADQAGWCSDDAARKFIEWIDARTKRRCTLFQLQIVYEMQKHKGES